MDAGTTNILLLLFPLHYVIIIGWIVSLQIHMLKL